jgi:hypothetical protein
MAGAQEIGKTLRLPRSALGYPVPAAARRTRAAVMSRVIRDSRRRGTRPGHGRTEPAPPGWEAAASGLLDCISDGTAADLPVLSVAGLAAGFGVTGEAAEYALRVLAVAGIVVRQPDLTFHIAYACHLPRIGKPADSRIWVQMANSILAAIELGLLEPGKPVLTVRALASCWDASREPVSKAYRELAWLGYLAKIPGHRYTVASGITAERLPGRCAGPAAAASCGGGRP